MLSAWSVALGMDYKQAHDFFLTENYTINYNDKSVTKSCFESLTYPIKNSINLSYYYSPLVNSSMSHRSITDQLVLNHLAIVYYRGGGRNSPETLACIS